MGLGLTRRAQAWREAGRTTEIIEPVTLDEDEKQVLAQQLVAQAKAAGRGCGLGAMVDPPQSPGLTVVAHPADSALLYPGQNEVCSPRQRG